MRYSWKIATPYLLGLAVALTEATLHWLGTLSVSGPTAVLTITLAKVVGDYIRAQLLTAEAAKDQPQPAAPVGEVVTVPPDAITLPALPVVDPALLVGLVEAALREHLAPPPTITVTGPATDAFTIPPPRTKAGRFDRKGTVATQTARLPAVPPSQRPQDTSG